MNQLILLGNVGNDAEVHQFENNRFAIRFNLAVTENWKDNQGNKQSKTEWFRCVRFTTSAALATYIKKGTKLLVIGKATADAYIKDNEAIAVPGCNVREIQFLDASNSNNSQQQNVVQNKTESAVSNQEIQEDDLPF